MTAQAAPALELAFTGQVHPFADRFPMLDDDSLNVLVRDITSNGLLNPIVLDPEGLLLDGRNRLRACEIAGIEPSFVLFDGDPVAFIIDQNLQRRDLTQGQKAHLVIAGSDSESEGGELADLAGVSRSAIAEAAVVRRYAPEASDAVIAGTMPHSSAYEAGLATQAECLAILTEGAPDILATGLYRAEQWAAHETRTIVQRIQELAARREQQEWDDRLRRAVELLQDLTDEGAH